MISALGAEQASQRCAGAGQYRRIVWPNHKHKRRESSSCAHLPPSTASSHGRDGQRLDVLLALHVPLTLTRQRLPALLLVVAPLRVLQLARQSLHVVFVLIHLCLIHVELRSHRLHRFRLVAEALLVDGELLRDLGARLARQNVLQLDVQLVFLLDEQIFLDHLLRLGDEPLLQRLDLLHHLIRPRIRAVQLAPPVRVVWVLKFLRQRLDLGSVLQQLVLQRVHLLAKAFEVGARRFLDVQLAPQRVQL
mmetsp:Transcript_5488/g.12645  ORF Transcript_5488/g.12645 Transcript_5488/m.12645 type:complete len:249 (+) Transcript_5488:90-836(+)